MYEEILQKLSTSDFRRRFCLKDKDKQYIRQKGLDTIRQHAEDFMRQRVATAYPYHDGKQTPMKGHPVFVAQHATACCCRSCIYKWHHFEQGVELTDAQQQYLVGLIMAWIEKQI